MLGYNKYGNKKICIDGITFDSKREAQRYQELKLLERAREITDLKLQPVFELQPTFKKNGKTIRAIKYKADFEYIEKGVHTVEDVKGFKTKEYMLKSKMFMYKYPGINFVEVF